jgi:hypothetical protein
MGKKAISSLDIFYCAASYIRERERDEHIKEQEKTTIDDYNINQ